MNRKMDDWRLSLVSVSFLFSLIMVSIARHRKAKMWIKCFLCHYLYGLTKVLESSTEMYYVIHWSKKQSNFRLYPLLQVWYHSITPCLLLKILTVRKSCIAVFFFVFIASKILQSQLYAFTIGSLFLYCILSSSVFKSFGNNINVTHVLTIKNKKET